MDRWLPDWLRRTGRTLAAALAMLPLAADASSACAADGEPIQWIADYCMLVMETDDEIAVSGCIEAQGKIHFRDACTGNIHFKRGMCERVLRNGTRAGTLEQCVNDPAFRGRTVAARGVGG